MEVPFLFTLDLSLLQTDDVHGGNVRIKTGQHWITFPEQIQFDSSLNPVITSITPNVSSTAGMTKIKRHIYNIQGIYNDQYAHIYVKTNKCINYVLSLGTVCKRLCSLKSFLNMTLLDNKGKICGKNDPSFYYLKRK